MGETNPWLLGAVKMHSLGGTRLSSLSLHSFPSNFIKIAMGKGHLEAKKSVL